MTDSFVKIDKPSDTNTTTTTTTTTSGHAKGKFMGILGLTYAGIITTTTTTASVTTTSTWSKFAKPANSSWVSIATPMSAILIGLGKVVLTKLII